MRYDQERLRDEIARRQITVTDFARQAGISKFNVYRALKGGRANTRTLGKIAAALNIEEPSELLEEEISMTQEKTIVKEIKGATREELQAAINAAIAEAESANLVLTNCVITALDKNGEHSELLIFKTTEVS